MAGRHDHPQLALLQRRHEDVLDLADVVSHGFDKHHPLTRFWLRERPRRHLGGVVAGRQLSLYSALLRLAQGKTKDDRMATAAPMGKANLRTGASRHERQAAAENQTAIPNHGKPPDKLEQNGDKKASATGETRGEN